MSATTHEMDRLCINTIRTLAMDAVQAANSGHPGTPMAMAPVAYTLWRRYAQYRDSVLPPRIIARVAVEQAPTLGWARYVGSRGARIGMETFGASAPLSALQQKFGFTPGRIVAAARKQLDPGRS